MPNVLLVSRFIPFRVLHLHHLLPLNSSFFMSSALNVTSSGKLSLPASFGLLCQGVQRNWFLFMLLLLFLVTLSQKSGPCVFVITAPVPLLWCAYYICKLTSSSCHYLTFVSPCPLLDCKIQDSRSHVFLFF